MAANIDAVNAYRGMVDQIKGVGLESRDQLSSGEFKDLVSGNKGLSSIAKDMVTTTIETVRTAEQQSQLAAQGKANPTQVAHSMQMAALSIEGTVNTVSKVLESYKTIISTPL